MAHAEQPQITRPRGAKAGRSALGDFAAGGAMAMMSIAYSLSFSALVFAGPLADLARAGVAAAALSSGIACLAFAALSSNSRVVGGPDTPVIAVAAALAAGVATQGAADAAQAQSNAVAALALAAMFSALCLGAVGAWRLAGWLRFVPYPVTAGFLASSGALLAGGGVALAAGLRRDAAFDAALDLALPPPALAAAGVACVIFVARRITRSALAAPLLVLAAGAAVSGAAALDLVPIATLRAGGWLPAAIPADGVLLPAMIFFDRPPDFSALAGFGPEIVAVALVAGMALMLNAAALEAEIDASLDLDREFIASAAANAASSTFGGLVSNLSLGRSVANVEMGASGRLSAVAAGLLCVAFAAAGPHAAAYVPMPALGGMLIYMGCGMLRQWLWRGALQLSRGEAALALAIFGVIVGYGYLEGVALGVTASCVSFALACARAPAVRQRLTRADYASFVDRPAEDEAALRAAGGRIRIFRLQGFLFFGVASRLVDEARAAAEAEARALPPGAAPGHAVVLDFHAVTGVDSTARAAFVRLRRQLADCGALLVLTGIDPEGRRIRALGVEGAPAFPSLEMGLEVCEDHLLAALGGGAGPVPSIAQWLDEALDARADPAARPAPRPAARPAPRPAERIAAILRLHELAAGEVLCRQGEAPDALFFIVGGRVSIYLDAPGGPRLRLRSALGRTVVGEIGFFTGAVRSASVIADRATEVWALDADAFARLKSDDPEAALALEELVIRILADRLTFANREVAALQ